MAVDDPSAFPSTPATKEESNITLDAHVLNKALQNTLLQLVQMI
jgi:DNA polymerase III sliding clamp (beta) subunit (PCNA family)